MKLMKMFLCQSEKLSTEERQQLWWQDRDGVNFVRRWRTEGINLAYKLDQDVKHQVIITQTDK